jgi:transcriptional regulator with PAS, ATPase and Fis domain
MNEYALNHKLDKFMADIPPSLFNDLSLPINFVDHHCNILVMNTAFLEYLEMPLKDVVGQNLVDIDNTTRFPIVLQTGIPEIGQKHRFKNGKEAIVDRIPIFDGDRIIGAAGLIFLEGLPADSIENKIRQSIIEKIRPDYRDNKTQQHNTLKALYGFDDIISNSKLIQHFKQRAKSFAKTDLPVLITGESGVGKELFAHAIHSASNRSDKPFVCINCAAIPDTLIESELFGYEAGSFTGANKQGKIGKFELANGGTIFLDEIGELPPMMQSKLLRVLQENQIEKIGSSESTHIDVRVVAATNIDLLKHIENKTFRADLYYRLNVLNLNIPSLRERPEDIPLLIEHFKSLFYQKNGIYKVFSKESLKILTAYHWPGNIRELKNIVYRLMVIAQTEEIKHDLIPQDILEAHFSLYADHYDPNELLENRSTLTNIMRDIESQIIEDTLKLCGNNKTKAADLLGIKRMTLYRKLKK